MSNSVICPTVTAYSLHQYREQMERVEPFAQRLHLDFMDGEFAPTKSPPLEHAWWPDKVGVDLHLMYKNPADYVAHVFMLQPDLLIIHAEAEGDFMALADKLQAKKIKLGVALLPKTGVEVVAPAISKIDHILIFSGDLGHFGGKADLSLLQKVKQLKSLKPEIEIGWDGGINQDNALELIRGGVDVLNVGGYIQRSPDPRDAYATLEKIIEEANTSNDPQETNPGRTRA